MLDENYVRILIDSKIIYIGRKRITVYWVFKNPKVTFLNSTVIITLNPRFSLEIRSDLAIILGRKKKSSKTSRSSLNLIYVISDMILEFGLAS